LLDVRGVTVRYGGASVLDAVALRIGDGEFVTLLGSNGAGKSTLFGVLSGIVRPAAGTVRFGDRELGRLAPARIVALGIAQCPEGRELFAELSVEKNLRLGAYVQRRDKAAVAESLAFVCDLFPPVRDKLRVPARALSGGQQQMVAIGRALMARPQLLLLDEPSLGLAPLVLEQTLAAVATINRAGTMVLLAEQNASAALAIAHRGYVLQDGKIVLQGTAADLRRNDDVRKAFIGA